MRARDWVVAGVVAVAFVACGGSSVSGVDTERSGGRDRDEPESNAGSSGQATTDGGGSGILEGGGGTDPGTDGGPQPLIDGGPTGAGGSPQPVIDGGPVGLGGSPQPVIDGGPIGAGGAPIPIGLGGAGGVVIIGSGGTGEVTLPDGCTPSYIENMPDYCGIDMQCGNEWVYAWCDMWDPTSLYCSCDTMGGWTELELSGLSGIAACEYVAGVCAGGGVPPTEFTDPPECMQTYQEMSTNWCSSEVQCTQSAEISPGVNVITREWQNTWCDLVDNAWTCSCDSNGSSMSFELPGATAPATACPTAIDICSQADLEVTGPLECTPTFQSASTDWCDAEQDCTRSATVSGTEIQVHEWVYTNCSPLTDGEWSCTCNGPSEASTFEVSGDDAWSTCTEASTTCVESLSAE